MSPSTESIAPPPPVPVVEPRPVEEMVRKVADEHGRPSQPTEAVFVYDGQDLEALADLPNYHRWILDGFGRRPRGRTLEVGAGIGNFAARYVDDVEELVLLEPAANLFPKLKLRFEHEASVTPVCRYVEDWAGDVEHGRFDTIVLVNVLEHVEDDVGMLRVLHSLLKPGGSLLLFVPAMPCLYGTLDALVDHHRRYTRGGLRHELQEAGFTTDRLRYFDLAGVLPWYVAGRVLKRDRFDAAAAHGYDRLVAPVMSRVERVLPKPIGKNLIAVARRPEWHSK